MKKLKTILLLTLLTFCNTNVFATFEDDFDPQACNALHVELSNGLILDRDYQGIRFTGGFAAPGNLIFALLPRFNNGDIIETLGQISFISHLDVGEELFFDDDY